MEVHHPHHVTHKKKWGEYLLEFLMLFLAVFLGFIAENIREGSAERLKEKHLIASLKKDLINDTANLNRIIKNISLHNAWVDSAARYLNSEEIKGNEKKLAASLTNATIWFGYNPPDVAVSEIRNTGNFNLIENENAKAGILNYISQLNFYNKYSEPLNNARHAMDTTSVSIFKSADYQKFTKAMYEAFKKGHTFISDSDLGNTIVFKTYNTAEYKRLSNKLEQENVLENDMLGQYANLYKIDTALIFLLQKEYHLEIE